MPDSAPRRPGDPRGRDERARKPPKKSPAPNRATRSSRQNSVTATPPPKKSFAAASLTFSLRAVIVAAVALVAVLVTVPVALQWADQARAHQALVGELEEVKARRQELETELSNWSNDDFIAAQARSRLGLVDKGETQFSVADAPEVAEETPKEESSRGPDRPWVMIVQESLLEADSTDE